MKEKKKSKFYVNVMATFTVTNFLCATVTCTAKSAAGSISATGFIACLADNLHFTSAQRKPQPERGSM